VAELDEAAVVWREVHELTQLPVGPCNRYNRPVPGARTDHRPAAAGLLQVRAGACAGLLQVHVHVRVGRTVRLQLRRPLRRLQQRAVREPRVISAGVALQAAAGVEAAGASHG
jgi:hypothetical protein